MKNLILLPGLTVSKLSTTAVKWIISIRAEICTHMKSKKPLAKLSWSYTAYKNALY